MAMTIRNDESMIKSYSMLKKNMTNFDKFFNQVVTGAKIKSAADDASGYSISEKMRVQLHGLNHDKINLQDGNALLAVAADAINNVVEELRSLKKLAITAANDTNTERDHMSIQKELQERIGNIDVIAKNTEYNGMALIDGSFSRKLSDTGEVTGKPLTVHHGTESGQHIWLFIESMKTETLKGKILDEHGAFINKQDLADLQAYADNKEKQTELEKILKEADGMTVGDISLSNNIKSRVAIRVLEGALETALGEATTIGAYQQRLQHNYNNVLTTEENIQAAESNIRDSDMADSMLGFAKNKFLVQASQSVLAQANQNASDVLGLLQ